MGKHTPILAAHGSTLFFLLIACMTTGIRVKLEGRITVRESSYKPILLACKLRI